MIANKADMIVNGYSFTCTKGFIRVLNLNNPNCATTLDKKGNVVETTMTDIELEIVKDYFIKNKDNLEVIDA